MKKVVRFVKSKSTVIRVVTHRGGSRWKGLGSLKILEINNILECDVGLSQGQIIS